MICTVRPSMPSAYWGSNKGYGLSEKKNKIKNKNLITSMDQVLQLGILGTVSHLIQLGIRWTYRLKGQQLTASCLQKLGHG